MAECVKILILAYFLLVPVAGAELPDQIKEYIAKIVKQFQENKGKL